MPGKPRIIYSWIENSPQKTYYSMAINGHTIYRLNYPEKLFKWYHVCQSWNGHTGEWQLWVNAERVGRGFYNLVSQDNIFYFWLTLANRIRTLAINYLEYSETSTEKPEIILFPFRLY